MPATAEMETRHQPSVLDRSKKLGCTAQTLTANSSLRTSNENARSAVSPRLRPHARTRSQREEGSGQARGSRRISSSGSVLRAVVQDVRCRSVGKKPLRGPRRLKDVFSRSGGGGSTDPGKRRAVIIATSVNTHRSSSSAFSMRRPRRSGHGVREDVRLRITCWHSLLLVHICGVRGVLRAPSYERMDRAEGRRLIARWKRAPRQRTKVTCAQD